jgi:hypothetical protein
MEREQLRADFDDQVFRAAIARYGRRLSDPGFWRDLCPGLTITDHPFIPAPPRRSPVDSTALESLLSQDGYLVTEPLVDEDERRPLVAAALRLQDAGLPSAFACVFDEYWRLFHGLEPLLASVLGAHYLIVPDGLWLFHVPPDATGLGRWTAVGPHRDSIGPDAHLQRTGAPGILNIWVALTDATPLNSCIYVLPASLDAAYADGRDEAVDAVSLQHVRAVPAPAGAVIAWTPHLLHWGGRPSPLAAGPRISAAAYVQRADLPPYHPDAFAPDAAVPFEARLRWIAASMRVSW